METNKAPISESYFFSKALKLVLHIKNMGNPAEINRDESP